MGTTKSIRVTLGIGLAMALALLTVAPAYAAIYTREPYEWSDSGSYQCDDGSWVDWQAGGSGAFTLRRGTGADAGVYFAHDRFYWSAVDTRRSDGTSLYTTGHGNTIDAQATSLGGTIFEVTTVEAGQPSVVTDEDGNVLQRNRGTIRRTFVLDTLGDDDPGGEVLIEDLTVRVNGPHPDAVSCDLFG